MKKDTEQNFGKEKEGRRRRRTKIKPINETREQTVREEQKKKKQSHSKYALRLTGRY